MKASQAISPAWKLALVPNAPIAFGFDPATTEKQTSNPSGFACVQKVGSDFIVRLIARWKTNDPEIAKQIVSACLRDLPHSLRPRRLVVDASNERYFAAALKAHLSGVCPVELVTSTQNITVKGEVMPMKVYLGNLLINTLEDGRLLLPSDTWIEKDFRLVKRDRGSFSTEIDANGGHGDSFDAVKNALHGLISSGGPAEASAYGPGMFGQPTRNGHPMRPDDDDDFQPNTGPAL